MQTVMDTAPPPPATFHSLPFFYKCLLALALVLLAASAATQFMLADAGAKSWLLYAAGRILEGRRLYVDIFEVNPPLILWIDLLPVWVSLHLPFLKDYHCLALMALLVIAGMLGFCARLLRHHPAFAHHALRRFLFLLLCAYVLIFYTSPVYFFDREQFMFILVFPYMLRWMPSLANRPLPLTLRMLAGGMAAVGFCMKPHALVVFAVLQAVYIIRERSLRILFTIENILIYLAIALYLLFIALFVPEYFTVMFPMAMQTYLSFRQPIVSYASFSLLAAMILGLAFADFSPRQSSAYRRDIPYFLGACLAFLLYALANNGWGYTFEPLICCALILCGWMGMEYHCLKAEHARLGLPCRKFIFGMRSCATVFMLGAAYFIFCLSTYFLTSGCSGNQRCEKTTAFEREAMKYPRRSFGSTPIDQDEWVELARLTHTQWDTRFNYLFMLPKLLLGDAAFRRKNQWIYDYVSHAYADDINRWKPDTMFIDTSPILFGSFHDIDLVAFLSSTPQFREAWKAYHLTATIDICHVPAAHEPASALRNSDCRFAVYQRGD